MLKIEIDKHSGFCFGVQYAIEMAEDHMEEQGTLYCLGDIVHNEMEVQRLEDLGLKIISREDLSELRDVPVLIRAHGEPPETYRRALANNITLIDASCPVVLKLQNRVRNAVDEDRQIVLLGKKGHAEVEGLTGQTGGKAIVVSSVEEAEALELDGPVSLFSQTTKSSALLHEVRDSLAARCDDLKFNDTICRQVSNREPTLKKFAARHDVVIFVAGKKSSNGRALFQACLTVNPNCHYVSTLEELDFQKIEGASSLGICGATSTPMWLMEAVAEEIAKETQGELIAS